jgi:hypothetical protein
MMQATQIKTATIPIALAFGCALLLQAGCGSSAYEEKFQTSLVDLKNETPFRNLFKQPTPIADSPLSLRLPKLFEKGKPAYALDAETPDPKNKTKPLDPERLQPRFIELPGHVRTYERFVPHIQVRKASKASACYCYIAVTDIESGSGENIEASLRKQLFAEFGESRTEDAKRRNDPPIKKGVTEWEDAEVPTPTGGDSTLQLRKLVAYGNQTFHYYDPKQDVRTEIRHGKYILYLYSNARDRGNNPTQFVLIGMRAEESVANNDQIELEQLGDALAGTIALDYSKPNEKSGDK